MPKRRLHLTFPESLINEPLIWKMGRQYALVTNIRRANVEENVGWVILEAQGTEESLEAAIRWLREMGVQVASLDGGPGTG